MVVHHKAGGWVLLKETGHTSFRKVPAAAAEDYWNGRVTEKQTASIKEKCTEAKADKTDESSVGNLCCFSVAALGVKAL